MSRALNVVLVVALIVVAGAKSGIESYVDAFEAWTEEKIARTERARRMPRTLVWSKRCERQGKDALVKRADMQPWQIHCVPRRVLTVAAL